MAQPDGLGANAVRQGQHRCSQHHQEQPIRYELDVCTQREPRKWSAWDHKAPHQTCQHESHSMNQNLPAATVNAHPKSLNISW